MEIKVNFLDKLRLEAKFDDFTVISDQPIRYKGRFGAGAVRLLPGLLGAVRGLLREAVLRHARHSHREHPPVAEQHRRSGKPLQADLQDPGRAAADLSAKDRQGILRSIDRCTVKKAVQAGPDFVIEEVENLDADAQALLTLKPDADRHTYIVGKDLPLEQTIANMTAFLAGPGDQDRDRVLAQSGAQRLVAAHPRCALVDVLHQRQGATKESALASALGEYIERLSCNHFYTHQFWGEDIANADFVHYPDERWFKPGEGCAAGRPARRLLPADLQPRGRAACPHLYDTNSGNVKRGICAPPYVRQSDGEGGVFPTNLIDNLYLSNGMSAGNTLPGAGAVPVGNLRTRGQARNHRRRDRAAGCAVRGAGEVPGIVAGIEALESRAFRCW